MALLLLLPIVTELFYWYFSSHQQRVPLLRLQFQTAIHSALRAKSQVQLSLGGSLLNVFIVWSPDFSLHVCYYSGGSNYYRFNLFFDVHEQPQNFHLLFAPSDSFIRFLCLLLLLLLLLIR